MRNKIKVFIAIGAVMLILLGDHTFGCAFFGDEYNPNPEEAKKSMEEDKKWNAWIEKYIENVLYVGMPEDEFVRLFTKYESWVDQERPYIISRKNNRYTFLGINDNKFRVTFKNQLLDKLEHYGLNKFILCYTDVSIFLRGYRRH